MPMPDAFYDGVESFLHSLLFERDNLRAADRLESRISAAEYTAIRGIALGNMKDAIATSGAQLTAFINSLG